MFLKKKYALVLAGGGAKGAYQIGAWKAFKELKIKFKAIAGTSAGALNGALMCQNDYKKALELWNNMSLEKIVSIPSEVIKDGKIDFNSKNLSILKDFRKNFFKNMGLDTNPLRNIIEKNVNEKKIRRSKIDFGLVTYELENFKSRELFIDEIEEGMLKDYLMASASLPGFKATKIRGKHYTDGGVYDNLPFGMIKERGYKDIIILDISGLGINRTPDIVGTNTILIKNSIDMGGIFDFSNSFIRSFMKLGYLDTLKAFGKIDGIVYFYKINKKITQKIEKILFNKDVFDEYQKYFRKKNLQFSKEEIIKNIQEILPKSMKKHKYLSIPLAESAALSLNLEKNNNYKYSVLIKSIWKKYNDIEKTLSDSTIVNNHNFFEILSHRLKNIDFSKDIKHLFKATPYELERDLEHIFGKDIAKLRSKALENFFPHLLPAKIFFTVLKRYFNSNN